MYDSHGLLTVHSCSGIERGEAGLRATSRARRLLLLARCWLLYSRVKAKPCTVPRMARSPSSSGKAGYG